MSPTTTKRTKDNMPAIVALVLPAPIVMVEIVSEAMKTKIAELGISLQRQQRKSG